MSNSAIWHPFTQMKTAPPPLKVKRGEGVMLELEDGRQILDCISSWWVTIHGHSHPVLAEALYQQAKQLEQVIFAGFTHEPAEKLATGLLKHLPKSLTRVFFSDNGSTAIEVALKMAYQYWFNQGEKQRTRFISFEGGYHGDTVGAMSVGSSSPWWQTFKTLMFATDIVPFPATFDEDSNVATHEAQALDCLAELLQKNSHSYAGIFIEPLVQGAAGMRLCRPQFLQELAKLARTHGVLLIYDEVMTGFGRTGELFACLKSSTCPDILCLSKGLSGGCLPLSVTVATEEIYQAFYSDDIDRAFFHSHSYTGNPLACATGNASLELLTQNPDVFRGMEALHRRYMETWLSGHPKIERTRICGTIAALDLKAESESYLNATGSKLRSRFLELGFLLRPLGNTIYLMPPYCITPTQLESIYEVIRRVVDE
ncbi:adenosylmethionine--8-amino-7-oxononanoate transaminase [Chroococcidiopsis sp. CCNUC1]|jgi:adenosylmethionine---8-amino-7-oxononanoate aminotransferase|uniref:adenosylmethionine--8-amino-7-oxononanoate transaminase n=1 Tax=Chroococcidiopsis sp. CCNUC1 TaxID=2653189 RepID=UPI0020202140|nr:adenosylmethionine--8-amino-7-oxononanoate transaminase [Chroococcidiopsis sp. CCNUC1]URD52835.1 adenosylmethionine--8-amino-7-oxononanoate transaminase [Chroococcidiopsis sp. CCNUC1]